MGKEEKYQKYQIPKSWGKKKSYGAPHIFGPGEEEKVEKVDKGGVYEVFM